MTRRTSRKEKGITLIALIITIIVLLILVGITVGTLKGQNGLLGHANKAKERANYSSAKEIINIEIYDALIERIQKGDTSINIKQLAEYFAQDSQLKVVLTKYSATGYLKPGIENYTGELKGIYVQAEGYNQYTFLIGENCELESVSDDGITFEYISEYEDSLGIKTAKDNKEQTENEEKATERLKESVVQNIENDIKSEIAKMTGKTASELSMASIEKNMTQAEFERVLEKYGIITYDENYNITGLNILGKDSNSKGVFIPISEIYQGTYKEETKTIAQNTSYSFNAMNSDVDSENVQEMEIKQTGEYEIQCWGAQGGTSAGGIGGYGAYTKGIIRLKKGDKIYIYIGKKGSDSTNTKGGYNGGGYSSTTATAAGGGSTDVRLVKGKSWDDSESLASRIMVAAGGSGGNQIQGPSGGALIGKKMDTMVGDVATQTKPAPSGSFGKAGIINDIAGAGGGYYGGGAHQKSQNSVEERYLGPENSTVKLDDTFVVKYGAGNSWVYKICTGSVSLSNDVFGDPCYGTVKSGYIVLKDFAVSSSGSSYISGHEGCIAIKSQTDLTPKVSEYKNLEDSIHYSGKYFKNTFMSAGDEGGYGNSGNGRVIITLK